MEEFRILSHDPCRNALVNSALPVLHQRSGGQVCIDQSVFEVEPENREQILVVDAVGTSHVTYFIVSL
jgi:hypothetical protein